MSTADRSNRGFTFIEMVMVLAIAALGALLMERALASTRQADQVHQAVHRAIEKGAHVAYDVRELAGSSRRIFDASGDGPDYFAALDLTSAPPAPGARLPSVDELGRLEPDAPGTPFVGNVLLVAREADPVACVADATTGQRRFIDTYRFACAYPTVSPRRLVANSGLARDLVLWRSHPFPSLPQLRAIDDPVIQERVVADLVAQFGMLVAWDPEQPPASAFFALGSDGSIALLPQADPTIAQDVVASPGRRLVAASLQLAATDPAVASRAALFSVEPVSTWSPHGFEVKVVGPSGARKVGLRVVVEAPVGLGPLTTCAPTTVFVSARNL
jgi:prepilin-type N-terminal cleavage/methylation domain-containing protein